MAHLALTCPHCETQRSAFSSLSARAYTRGDLLLGELYMQCATCHRGVIVHFTPNVRGIRTGELEYIAGDPIQQNWRTIDVWPARSEPAVPNHTPKRIGDIFLQAADNLRRRHFDASGSMDRKVLDLTTKHLDPEKAKQRLLDRIDALAAAHRITPDMKEWAHAIRVDGNDAAHDEPSLSPEEADDLHAFTTMFLRYVFELPGMLAERRDRSSTAAAPPP